MRGWRVGAALGLLVGVGAGATAQQLPPLEAVFELRTARIEPGTTTRVDIEDIASRLATQTELESIALGDFDGNGVPDLVQACSGGLAAIEAACLAHGSPSGVDLMEWFLTENSTKELYSQEQAITVAEQAGFPPDQIVDWRERYLEPPPEPEPTCRDCLVQVYEDCKDACQGKTRWRRVACIVKCKIRRARECRQTCREERREQRRRCKTKWKKWRKKKYRPPPKKKTKKKREGFLERVADAVHGAWSKFRSLTGGW